MSINTWLVLCTTSKLKPNKWHCAAYLVDVTLCKKPSNVQQTKTKINPLIIGSPADKSLKGTNLVAAALGLHHWHPSTRLLVGLLERYWSFSPSNPALVKPTCTSHKAAALGFNNKCAACTTTHRIICCAPNRRSLCLCFFGHHPPSFTTPKCPSAHTPWSIS